MCSPTSGASLRRPHRRTGNSRIAQNAQPVPLPIGSPLPEVEGRNGRQSKRDRPGAFFSATNTKRDASSTMAQVHATVPARSCPGCWISGATPAVGPATCPPEARRRGKEGTADSRRRTNIPPITNMPVGGHRRAEEGSRSLGRSGPQRGKFFSTPFYHIERDRA